uniref:Uncharacterized protein n=1 Tax=Candidatus Kentrum sp. MB TaxID=2138164 RepID=A0A450XWY7_9GAMM|nr:MAG: hypothetical protein BECKMB1821G_GA0114241_11881 [Candidatus Kentron sp. MB]
MVTDFRVFSESAVTMSETPVTFLGIFSNILRTLEFSLTMASSRTFWEEPCQLEEFQCEKFVKFYASSTRQN